MKKKISLLVFILLLIALVGYCTTAWFLNPERLTPENSKGKEVYYTMIDNTDVTQSTTDDRYNYTLPCYNDKGTKKELTFSASKKLRENAYLKLYNTTLRGVTYWQEVEYNELPEDVQKIYTTNSSD